MKVLSFSRCHRYNIHRILQVYKYCYASNLRVWVPVRFNRYKHFSGKSCPLFSTAFNIEMLLIKMYVASYSRCSVNWLACSFQITTAGRGGRTGLRWRGAATLLWGKPLGTSWPELLQYSPSTEEWTGHPSMAEIGSCGEKGTQRLLLVGRRCHGYTTLNLLKMKTSRFWTFLWTQIWRKYDNFVCCSKQITHQGVHDTSHVLCWDIFHQARST